jgi:hypothetical protein
MSGAAAAVLIKCPSRSRAAAPELDDKGRQMPDDNIQTLHEGELTNTYLPDQTSTSE